MRYWHCFGLDGLVCLEFFFGYKCCYKLKKVIKPSRAKTTWTDSYELCQEKERSGWWHVNNVKLVCAEKMRNVSFFNILVCLLLRYDYSLSIWLSVICNIPNNELEIYNIESYSSILVFCCKTVIYVSSNVFAFILVSCWKFYRWQM